MLGIMCSCALWICIVLSNIAPLLLFILILAYIVRLLAISFCITYSYEAHTSTQAHNNIKCFGFCHFCYFCYHWCSTKNDIHRDYSLHSLHIVGQWQDALHIFGIKFWDESYFYIPSYFHSKLFYGTSFSTL